MPILTLEQLIAAKPFVNHPLPKWASRPAARITSRHKSRNPERPTHCGNDFCYPAIDSDLAKRVESGYTTPADTPCYAGCYGYVQKTRLWIRGENNGAHAWINIFTSASHEDSTGWRHLCHHLSSVVVKRGDWVEPDTIIGWFGDDSPCSPPHLHHELSPYDHYDTEDSAVVLDGAPMPEWPMPAEPWVPTRDRALIAFERSQDAARARFVEELG